MLELVKRLYEYSKDRNFEIRFRFPRKTSIQRALTKLTQIKNHVRGTAIVPLVYKAVCNDERISDLFQLSERSVPSFYYEANTTFQNWTMFPTTENDPRPDEIKQISSDITRIVKELSAYVRSEYRKNKYWLETNASSSFAKIIRTTLRVGPLLGESTDADNTFFTEKDAECGDIFQLLDIYELSPLPNKVGSVEYNALSKTNSKRFLYISHTEKISTGFSTTVEAILPLTSFTETQLRAYWSSRLGRYVHWKLDGKYYDNVRGEEHIYEISKKGEHKCHNCLRSSYVNTYFGPAEPTEKFFEYEGYFYCESCYKVVARKLLYKATKTQDGYYVPDIFKDKADNYNRSEVRACLGGINSYNYAPPHLHFIWDEEDRHVKPRLYMGTEIEVDARSRGLVTTTEDARVVLATLTGIEDFAYGMSDGSLNCGFEIGVMPATLAAHKNILHYKEFFSLLNSLGYAANDIETAGLHVHVNRKFFSGKSAEERVRRGLMMALVMENNWKDFHNFSRRSCGDTDISWGRNNHANRYFSKDDCIHNEQRVFEFLGNAYNSGDKYVCLNFRHNNTFEFRIFKGTLNYVAYMATLQLVSNLSHMIREVTLAQAYDIKFTDILEYKHYEELDLYVASKYDGNDKGGC